MLKEDIPYGLLLFPFIVLIILSLGLGKLKDLEIIQIVTLRISTLLHEKLVSK